MQVLLILRLFLAWDKSSFFLLKYFGLVKRKSTKGNFGIANVKWLVSLFNLAEGDVNRRLSGLSYSFEQIRAIATINRFSRNPKVFHGIRTSSLMRLNGMQ